jgi:PST family polysaccharide transporter
MRAIVATIGGGLAGIGLAAAGFGVWALVAQQLAAAVLSVVLLWRISPWRPRLSFSGPDFRDLFGFGINVVGSDFLSFLSRNLDNLLIGAVLGTVPLGLYAVGYRILAVSQTLLLNVARRITFPAFARLQHDPERLVRAYFRVTRTGAAIILPGYVALALVAPEMTVVLFGERWAEAGLVAATLFLIGPVLSVQAFSNSLLNAAGHPEVVLRFRLLTTLLNVIGFAVAVWFGIIAVAAAFVVRGYLLLPLNLRWMRSYGGVPIRPYLEQLVPAATITVVMAAALLATKLLVVGRLPDPALLVLEILAGAAGAAATLLLVHRAFLRELVGVARDVVSRRTAPDTADPAARDEVPEEGQATAAPGPAPRL